MNSLSNHMVANLKTEIKTFTGRAKKKEKTTLWSLHMESTLLLLGVNFYERRDLLWFIMNKPSALEMI